MIVLRWNRGFEEIEVRPRSELVFPGEGTDRLRHGWDVLPIRGVDHALQLIGHDQDLVRNIRSYLASDDYASDPVNMCDHEIIARFATILAGGMLAVLRRRPDVTGWVGLASSSGQREGAAPAGGGVRDVPATAPQRRQQHSRLSGMAAAALENRGADGRGAVSVNGPWKASAPLASRPEAAVEHAIVCVVVDEQGVGLKGIEVKLARADGQCLVGLTGRDGAVLFNQLQPLSYTLRLDALDGAAWTVTMSAGLTQTMTEAVEARHSSWQVDRAADVIEGMEHQVGEGECVETVAYGRGFFWSTIWNHERNAALRELRGSPNILAPGDKVFVPQLTQKAHRCDVDQAVVIQRNGIPSWLRLQFLRTDFTPRPWVPYILEIGCGSEGTLQRRGTTDGEGWLVEAIFPNATDGVVTLNPDGAAETHRLSIATLNPLSNIVGWKNRLGNLGYDCGPPSAEMNVATRTAIKKFQHDTGMRVTGMLDPHTQNRLLKLSVS